MSVLARHVWRPVLAALVAGGTGVMVLPATAWAHVTIEPGRAQPGGYVREAFRVPNERDDAATVKLQVIFPADHPLASVSVLPLPGWTATVEKATLARPVRSDDGEVTEAVSSITWSGGSIGAGQFQEFPVTFGPLPQAGTRLVFKTLQTYSDGQIVRWIEVPMDDGPKPEHPAPVVTVAAPAAVATPAAPAGDSDAVAVTLGAAGLLAGLAGLGVALTRRRTGVPVPRVEASAEDMVRT